MCALPVLHTLCIVGPGQPVSMEPAVQTVRFDEASPCVSQIRGGNRVRMPLARGGNRVLAGSGSAV
jgi:hypothetical protein